MAKGKEYVKMSVLARRSGVPAATIKHYLREGLLDPPRRTARNMAWYDASQVPRIKAIKQLQKEHFLPLKVIKELLDKGAPVVDDLEAAEAIARTLARAASPKKKTRAQLLQAGVKAEHLDWLEKAGIVTPVTDGDTPVYTGDDLALLQTLGQARKEGLSPDMLPFEILETYLRAIQDLVRAELELFRAGVEPRAGRDLGRLTEIATTLSERLVVLLRRKLLLPTLQKLVEEESLPTRDAGKNAPRR